MGSFEPTPEQRRAMEDRGGSLLVSAAAGSGKTKVLVERLFGYMERERCRIDDFLIITYTKAAAAELRGKIAAELTKRLAQQPGDQHLKRQVLRVYRADIKTVDAFCTALLRESTHLLAEEGQRHALTADFRVLDENDAALLRKRVLGRVLEAFYENTDAGAAPLADTLGAGRDDSALENLVLETYEKLQSHASPEAWLERNRTAWTVCTGDFDETPYADALLRQMRRKVHHWSQSLLKAASALALDPQKDDLYRGYGEKFIAAAESIAELEKDYLELSGFEVEIAGDGTTGLDKALNEEFDLIILDLMLPGTDGFEICRKVREVKNTPIIMVSAKKEDIDKIRGLGLGADDYMTKPFSPSEMVARVKAHLARYERLIGSGMPANDVIEIRGLKIDKTARRVWVNGEEKNFTTKEFDLLAFLAQNPNHVFTKEELFSKIWDMESVGDIATVTVHIKKIREKIEFNTAKPQYIETIWGVGYRFKM